jgi:hypothetical protein
LGLLGQLTNRQVFHWNSSGPRRADPGRFK